MMIESIRTTQDVTLISFHEFPTDIRTVASVFQQIADAGIDVDMISQVPPNGTRSGLSFTVSDEDFGKILPIVTQLRTQYPGISVSVSSGNCKISVYGPQMNGTPGVAAKVFAAAADANADLRMITTSETDISLLVVKADVDNSTKAIEDAFA